jgi:hypothetical protein
MTIKIEPTAVHRGKIIVDRSDDDPTGFVVTFDASPHAMIVQKMNHAAFLQFVLALNRMALGINSDSPDLGERFPRPFED